MVALDAITRGIDYSEEYLEQEYSPWNSLIFEKSGLFELAIETMKDVKLWCSMLQLLVLGARLFKQLLAGF
jgi:hypothetical protein